jgi:dihydroorotase
MSATRLFGRDRRGADLLIRGAHVLDPRTHLNEPHDVLIRGGQIAELGAPDSLSDETAADTIQASGKHLFPGFVDPHVHLRTPGQEHKEDLDTGTEAGAAGGYCAVIAMPNTDPTVDTAAVLGALIRRARNEARVPVGFLASITRGLRGQELTEMAELSDAGALGFTDDGKPVVSAGMLRKALQYQRLSGGVIALHEEDPALSGDGVMHDDDRPRQRAGSVRGRPHALSAPVVCRVGPGPGRGQGGRHRGQWRSLPAPPDADR